MPRRARYRTPLFEAHERQIAFAPEEALERQMESAERLVREVDPQATYPFEFVIWRLTGYRADTASTDLIAGEDLRADLSTFVLRCSERLPLTAEDRPGGAVAVGALAAELGIAEKTLRRWRDRGLLFHRLRFRDGRSRVGAYRASFELFAQGHSTLVEDARAFTRMDDTAKRTAIEATERLVGEGRTRNLAARDAARLIGRSHEAVRQLIDRRAAGAGRGRQKRSGDRLGRDRRLAYRAWRFGVPIDLIARRSNLKPDAVRRRIDVARAERLRSLRLGWIDFVTFERADAEETILAAPSVLGGLTPAFDPPEAIAIIEACAAERTPTPARLAEEDAMLAAYNWLKRRAKGRIVDLGRSPDRLVLDACETDLRWALRLKRRLVESWLPAAVVRVEQSIGGSLARRPAEEIRANLERTVRVVADELESLDPSRRQSPRRIIALETDRVLARRGNELRLTRAAVRHEGGTVPVAGLFDRLVPWQELVDGFASRRGALDRVEAGSASLLRRRFGWDGSPPRTLEALAVEERTTVARVVKRLLDAERALRIACR